MAHGATESMDGKKTIYIYAGPGTSEGCIRHIKRTLGQVVPKYSIKEIKPEAVLEGAWTQDAVLFVLPGGADIPYHEALNPHGNRIINQYVDKGGSFLGICAGAYYSGKAVEFARGTELEVLAERSLGFFPDVVAGPILKHYVYDSHEGAVAARIKRADNHHVLRVYYNGGGHFVNAESYPKVTVLAHYEDTAEPKKAATVHISHGDGNVVLSGAHWEYCPGRLDSTDPYLVSIIPDLQACDADRIQLAKDIFTRLSLGRI
jgi:glutamine amidotransferase-like uncharacterized protein